MENIKISNFYKIFPVRNYDIIGEDLKKREGDRREFLGGLTKSILWKICGARMKASSKAIFLAQHIQRFSENENNENCEKEAAEG